MAALPLPQASAQAKPATLFDRLENLAVDLDITNSILSLAVHELLHGDAGVHGQNALYGAEKMLEASRADLSAIVQLAQRSA